MSLNSFIVQEDSRLRRQQESKQPQAHLEKKPTATFYLYLPFTIEPDSWFLLSLAVPCVIF